MEESPSTVYRHMSHPWLPLRKLWSYGSLVCKPCYLSELISKCIKYIVEEMEPIYYCIKITSNIWCLISISNNIYLTCMRDALHGFSDFFLQFYSVPSSASRSYKWVRNPRNVSTLNAPAEHSKQRTTLCRCQCANVVHVVELLRERALTSFYAYTYGDSCCRWCCYAVMLLLHP